MMREIERRGGIVGMESNVPDDVLEQFLKEVLDCPDCRAAVDASAGLVDPAKREH